MQAGTQIDPGKIRAYSATRYRLGDATTGIALTIGQRSSQLDEIFVQQGVRCAAVITAWNPRGALRSAAENESAHATLAAALAEYGVSCIQGRNDDPSGAWPAEPSFLALGLDRETARTLGRRFGQDAIVWIGPDAVPVLDLLR